VIAALAYLVVRTNNERQVTPSFHNLSNSTLNRTGLTLLQDLKKSLNVTSLHVTYLTGNNQTIDSYHLAGYNKTVYHTNTYTIYYYETNMTLACLNQSGSSVKCSKGTGGYNYLVKFPYTAKNISMFGILMVEGNLTSTGTQIIAGRKCDNFEFSNLTRGNLLSNYSVINLCLDSQYGIPLYVNETGVIGGALNSAVRLTATYFSTNVSKSDFAIPASYTKALQNA
jgi:hypothetical protein